MGAYPWCRLWNELPWDRKIRRLDVEHRYLFVVCMTLASASPERGRLLLDSSDDAREVLTVEDIADAAAMPAHAVSDGLVMLGAAGLVEAIDPDDDRHTYELPILDGDGTVPPVYVLPKWDDRQFEGDKPSTERVKRYRERQRKARSDGETLGETLPDGSGNVTETVSEYRVQSTEKPTHTRARGKRAIPADWHPNDTHHRIAAEQHLDVDVEAERFRDYCASHDKRYKDHDAAFRNWLRNTQFRAPPQPARNGETVRLTATEQRRLRNLQAIQANAETHP